MTLTSKGQVTIPQDIRDRLGLSPGTAVEFDVVGDSVRIRKAPRQGAGRPSWPTCAPRRAAQSAPADDRPDPRADARRVMRGAVLVDSNVLLDIVTGDEQWLDWSAATLADIAGSHRLVINPSSTPRSPRASSASRTSRTCCRTPITNAARCPGRPRSWPASAS